MLVRTHPAGSCVNLYDWTGAGLDGLGNSGSSFLSDDDDPLCWGHFLYHDGPLPSL